MARWALGLGRGAWRLAALAAVCLFVSAAVAVTPVSAGAGSKSFVPRFFGIVPHIAYAPRLVDHPDSSFWETVVTVADVDDSPSHYVIKGFDASGNLIDDVDVVLAGHEVRDWNVNRWFPDLSADEYDAMASVTVESDDDFVLCERFKASGVAGGLELKVVEAGDWDSANSMLLSDKEYFGHVAEGWKWWTGVAIYTDLVGSSFSFDLFNYDGGVDNLVGDFVVDGVPVDKVAFVVEDFSGCQDGSWALFGNGSSLSYELFGVHEDVQNGGSSLGVLSGLDATGSYELGNEFFVPVNDVDWSGIAVLNPNDYAVTGVIEQFFLDDSSPFGSVMAVHRVPFVLGPYEKKTGIVGVGEGYDFDLGGFSRDDGVVRVVLNGDYDQWTGVGGLAVELVQGDDAWSHNEGITGLGRLDVGKRLVAPYVSNTTVTHDAVFDGGVMVGGTITPHETYLSLTNVDDGEGDWNVQMYNVDGSPHGNVKIIHLKPFQTWRGTLGDLYGDHVEGSLVINGGKLVGSYTLMGSDVNAPLVADEHLQSSMMKMIPVNRGEFTSSWEKYSGNPILSKSNEVLGERVDWDYFCAADCSVLKDGDTYKMWYTGSGQTETDSVIRVRIGYAYSSDGISWTKYENNPVLGPTHGTWDSVGLETVSVLLDNEAPETERYKMWYAGVNDENTGLYSFGYAYSSDGINWVKYEGNPILEAGPSNSWESGSPEGPTVIKDNGIFKMWYGAVDTVDNGQETDYRSNIGYAWSVDGKSWEKYPDNPVLLTGDWGSWDAAVIQDPFVMKIDETYYMWYSGFPEWIEGTDLTGIYQIGLAYSSDGITWTKSENNPVLKKGSNGSWDDVLVGFPSIILDGDVLRMYYTGLNESVIPEFPNPYHWDIGCATCNVTDLINQ